MRTNRLLVVALVIAAACTLGARVRTVVAQSGWAGVDVPLAAVYQPPYEQLEVFVVGDDGAVRGVWKEHNSIWRPPFTLTGPGLAPPGAPVAAVFQPRNNQVEVFVVSNDGAVWDIWKANNGPWQPPIRLTDPNFAPAGAGIAAVFQPRNDQLEVFVVGRDGAIWDVWKERNSPWRAPIAISKPNAAREGSPIAAVYEPRNEQLEVFTVGRDGSVQDVWKAQNGPWQPLITVSGPNFAPTSAPLTVVYYPNGEHMELFVVGNDGAIRGTWKAENGPWQPNLVLTGPDFASPRAPIVAVYQPRNDQLEVFVVGKDGAIWDVWKAKGINWQPAFKTTDPGFVRDGTPLAAAVQALNDQMEVFAIDGNGAARGVYKAQNGPWQRPFSLTGIYFTPVFLPGDCSQFFRKWRNGSEDDYLMENCVWIMGIEPYCRAHDAFSAVAWDGNRRYLKCAPYAHPDDALDQIEHIARGVYEGLITAYVAAAPYLDLVVQGGACLNGVIYACATLALDVAGRAGLQLPDVPADAIAIASQVSKCVDGDIAACAQVGARGAKAVGAELKIPGMDVGRIAADTQQCARGDFAACVRLGLAAAKAGGVPIDLGPGDISNVRDCLSAISQACLSLGRSAARAAGFPLGGVTQGVESAQKCAAGDENACILLGKALVGSAMPQSAENAQKCAAGDNGACIDLGRSLIGSAAVQDAQKALRCEHGETDACLDLGKTVATRAGVQLPQPPALPPLPPLPNP